MKPRHITFCLYYLRNWNASEAARKAGYSENRAAAAGLALKNHPDIKRYINNKLKELWQDETDVIRARVFNLWAEMAFNDDLPQDASIQDRIARSAMQLKASELLAKYLPAGQLGQPDTEEDGEFKIIKIKAVKPNEGNRVLPAPEAN